MENQSNSKQSIDEKGEDEIKTFLTGRFNSALLKSSENLDADLADLSPKDRVTLIKNAIEKWDPEGKVLEDIPGMHIKEITFKITHSQP